MKSAYELAMERLNKTSPSIKLTEEQKKEIADLESRYNAKLAEREISLKEQITKAQDNGDYEGAEKLQQELVNERKKIQADLEEKKEGVRSRGR